MQEVVMRTNNRIDMYFIMLFLLSRKRDYLHTMPLNNVLKLQLLNKSFK
ncbi:hypothetical protein DDD_1898 [Nonlabens dokdonensis DSW-6]|uniref:Uncharacterized protein n=1 Tax=Nonlabens dokdonensis (strain DSM 17205 / KCTC 12402 / DSW-6) TaxID=592029 RepID=L7WAW2_NONDD|nr:hypothetical protein DDD_1898 [Nonlabens dokdonensis DSW-6]